MKSGSWSFIGKGPGNRGACLGGDEDPGRGDLRTRKPSADHDLPIERYDELLLCPGCHNLRTDKGYFTGKDAEFSFSDTYGPS